MGLLNNSSEIYIPDKKKVETAFGKTTHMAIGAHQDDLEIMAYDAISKCYGENENGFFGVVVTDGASSPRNGKYAEYTDEMMKKTRKDEQKKAADIGRYAGLALLDYESCEVKSYKPDNIIRDISWLLLKAQPETVYTHNLADKHETHVAVSLLVVKAIRSLPENKRPNKLFGCEVWRGLDWMLDEDKVALDSGKYPHLAQELIGVFDSQISGGKRYDKAALGRRIANATYFNSHKADTFSSLSYAMDLTPLIQDDLLDIKEYVLAHINRLFEDVSQTIDRHL